MSSHKHQLGAATGIVLAILWIGTEAAISKSSPLANWRFSDPHYTSNQYAKILGESGIGHDPDDKDKTNPGLNLNPEHLQIQYVDYQPHCLPGGVPVCATNGSDSFYFENDCRLEAHNMKMLFQYGTELEPTEMERCLPTCQTMKCTTVERPVCALAEIGGATPQTFANECEMRRRECHTKQVLRILHQGPCQVPTKSQRKKKQRRHKKKPPMKSISTSSNSPKSTSPPKKVYFLLATPRAALPAPRQVATTTPRPYKRRITTTPRPKPTKATSTSPSPMQFRQLKGLAHPMVSVSRAVNAYNVYNIPDVGHDYGEITDSSLSLYLPGVGRVTEAYTTSTSTMRGITLSPSTSTTMTTTTTPKPIMTTSQAFVIKKPLATTMKSSMPSTTAEMEEKSTVADLEAVTYGFSTTQESTTKIKTKSP